MGRWVGWWVGEWEGGWFGRSVGRWVGRLVGWMGGCVGGCICVGEDGLELLAERVEQVCVFDVFGCAWVCVVVWVRVGVYVRLCVAGGRRI